MKIFKQINLVMSEVGHISKDRKNDFQGYKFRGIEDMYAAIHPVFIKNGVFCAPEVLDYTATEVEKINKAGEVQISYRVVSRIRHRFYADDGSSVDVTTLGEGIDTSDKASNKAMSAAMKYAFIELLSIPTQDISDSDRENPEAGKTVKRSSGMPAIQPAQPDWNDGSHNKDVGYRIPFGKWNKRTIEEVPMHELKSYVTYLEKTAERDKKPITGVVKDFIERVEAHVIAFERQDVK